MIDSRISLIIKQNENNIYITGELATQLKLAWPEKKLVIIWEIISYSTTLVFILILKSNKSNWWLAIFVCLLLLCTHSLHSSRPWKCSSFYSQLYIYQTESSEMNCMLSSSSWIFFFLIRTYVYIRRRKIQDIIWDNI